MFVLLEVGARKREPYAMLCYAMFVLPQDGTGKRLETQTLCVCYAYAMLCSFWFRQGSQLKPYAMLMLSYAMLVLLQTGGWKCKPYVYAMLMLCYVMLCSLRCYRQGPGNANRVLCHALFNPLKQASIIPRKLWVLRQFLCFGHMFFFVFIIFWTYVLIYTRTDGMNYIFIP